MEGTVGDFWRMVWEYKSAAIVMLTQLEEEGEVSSTGWEETAMEGELSLVAAMHGMDMHVMELPPSSL